MGGELVKGLLATVPCFLYAARELLRRITSQAKPTNVGSGVFGVQVTESDSVWLSHTSLQRMRCEELRNQRERENNLNTCACVYHSPEI